MLRFIVLNNNEYICWSHDANTALDRKDYGVKFILNYKPTTKSVCARVESPYYVAWSVFFFLM